MLIAVGADAAENLDCFAQRGDGPAPVWQAPPLETGQVLHWPRKGRTPQVVNVFPCKLDRKRHRRKYAQGELSPERSFYFRGPENKLHLRAQILMLFLQLADGVDDETWEYHRRRKDYSEWLRGSIKDEELAANVARIELQPTIDPVMGRLQIRKAIKRNYTLPDDRPLPVPNAQ